MEFFDEPWKISVIIFLELLALFSAYRLAFNDPHRDNPDVKKMFAALGYSVWRVKFDLFILRFIVWQIGILFIAMPFIYFMESFQ